MASLASHYSQISVVMKVHVGALYQFQKSFPSHSARRRLPESARVEVLLWRSFLLSLHVNPASFARPFQGFRVRSATHTIEYDACFTHRDGCVSLAGRGGLVGPPRVLLGFAVLPSPFVATTDSSFQNTYEYLEILLGLLLSKSLGLRNGVFAVLGTVDPRWLGCCRVERVRCYVDVQVSDSLFLWRMWPQRYWRLSTSDQSKILCVTVYPVASSPPS